MGHRGNREGGCELSVEILYVLSPVVEENYKFQSVVSELHCFALSLQRSFRSSNSC